MLKGNNPLLWARPSPLRLIFEPCFVSFKDFCSQKKLHLELFWNFFG